jgi:predicted PurR-regulated permease PerM
VVQPYLISKGSNLPMLLTFMSALGGFLEWGIVGVFVGPVVFAVAYDLILRWVEGPALGTDAKPAQ